MLVALHYIGSTPTGTARDYAELRVPARVILPAGPYRYSSVPRYREGYSWFPDGYYDWGDDDQTASAMEELRRLASFVKRLTQVRPTLGRPVVTGYSQGGDLVHLLTLHYPEMLSGALPMGARFPSAWQRGAPATVDKLPSIHIFHGEADQIVPVSESAAAKAYFTTIGAAVVLHTYSETGHDYSSAMKNDFQRIAEELLVSDR
jgi:phospholipase/carboxylesterase